MGLWVNNDMETWKKYNEDFMENMIDIEEEKF
jgi:hypothetical protein